jgi:hypothetical protein
LIDEQPLQVLPSLAKAIGLDEALFLQQVHYWLKTSKHEDDGRRWIYNSYEDWLQQLPFFSLRKLERMVKALKARGLLLVRRHPGFDRRNWYSIDYQAFNVLTKSCDIQPQPKAAKTADTESATVAESDAAKMAGSYSETPESPENPAPRLSPDDFNKRLMAYHQSHIVGSIPNPAAQGKAINALYNDEFSAEDAKAVYDALRGDEWRTSDVSWLTVRKEIGTRLPALKRAQQMQSSVGCLDDEFGAKRKPRTFDSADEFALATGKSLSEVMANWISQ